MTIELKAEESGSPIPLEAGTYAATVAAVEEAPGNLFGDQVKLVLATTEEAGDGGEPFELWAYASRKLTTRSKLWRWVTAITGQAPELGKTFRIEEMLLGKPCRFQLVETLGEDGLPRKKISEILAPSKRAAKPQNSLPRFCGKCAEPVDYYAPDGQGFCNDHGPRAGQ